MVNKLLIAVFVLVFLVLVSGCSGGGAERAAGEFRVGIESSPASLDPRHATDAHGMRIVPLIFNGLLAKQPDGTLTTDLAQKWERPEPLVHRLTLRPDVRFHDGTVLTSADVAANYRYVMDKENGSPHFGSLEAVESVETPDTRTIVFRLGHPYVSFPFQLTLGILPARLAQNKALDGELVGTGPFELETLKAGEEIVLTAFADHFDGRPALERVRFRIVGSATTRMLEIQSGGLDLLQNAVPPYAVKFLGEQDDLRVITGSGSSYQYLGFNLEDELLSDPRVRQAISHGVDREMLIQYVMQGLARPATGVFTPEHWANAPDAPAYGFDPARAMKLLDEAGYPDPDGDGPLMRLTLSYKTSTDKTANEAARVIADQLAKIGVGVEVRSFEWSTFFGDVKAGNFQMYSLRWVGLSDPDVFYYIFHSDSVPPTGGNRGRYRNEAVDGWIEASREEFDLEQRSRLYRDVQQQVSKDCVYTSLWWPDNVVVLREGFTGYEVLPGGEYTSLKQVRPVN